MPIRTNIHPLAKGTSTDAVDSNLFRNLPDPRHHPIGQQWHLLRTTWAILDRPE